MPPAPARDGAAFARLGLNPALAQAAAAQGYTTPTPVQAAALPPALQGHDLVALAPTGSGKTAAFGLAVLQRLAQAAPPPATPRTARRPTRALVLVPTRDLAVQVGHSLQGLAQGLHPPVKLAVVFGGVSVNPQMLALRGGADLVVATPGRLLDLVQRNALHLAGVQMLVLDEADRLLDEGFADELARLKPLLPAQRQGLFFSATFGAAEQALAGAWLRQPLHLNLLAPTPTPASAPTPPAVEQHVVEVDTARRTALLRHLLQRGRWQRVLVFVATRHASEHVADKLRQHGVAAAAFHGDLSQGARTRVLGDLGRGALQVLLATDMAARGLHIPGLQVVVNYDLPRSATDYTHRIGRTARAGAAGLAVSFVSPATEPHMRLIEKRQGQRLEREHVLGFEPGEVPAEGGLALTPADPNGGVKGRRKSKKDKLREAARADTPAPASVSRR